MFLGPDKRSTDPFRLRPKAGRAPGWLAGHRRACRAGVEAPWMLATCFAACCVLLLAIGFMQRRDTLETRQRLEDITARAAALDQQLASAWDESHRSATNFQGRLTDFQRQVLQRTLEFERQKAALEKQLKEQTATHEQERATLRRLLEARTAESQTLQEAVAQAVGENKDRLAQVQVFLLSPAGEAAARTVAAAVWDGAAQRGMLQAEGLPAPPPGRDYQLWIRDPKYPIPLSAGLVKVPRTGTVQGRFQPSFPIEKATKLFVTLEPKGGAEQPQGPVVLTSP